MDKTTTSIIVSYFVSIIAVGFSILKADESTKEVQKAIADLEKLLIKKINGLISSSFNDMGEKLKFGFNKILAIQLSKSKNFSIEEMEIDFEVPSIIKTDYLYLKRIYSRIRKLEMASFRFSLFRYVIWSMFLIGSVLAFLNFFNYWLVKGYIVIPFVIFFIGVILTLFLDQIIISHFIKNIKREYGI